MVTINDTTKRQNFNKLNVVYEFSYQLELEKFFLTMIQTTYTLITQPLHHHAD